MKYGIRTTDDGFINSWMVFDNSRIKPVLIAKRENGHKEVVDNGLFNVIQNISRV